MKKHQIITNNWFFTFVLKLFARKTRNQENQNHRVKLIDKTTKQPLEYATMHW
jgi:hypothetical protein